MTAPVTARARLGRTRLAWALRCAPAALASAACAGPSPALEVRTMDALPDSTLADLVADLGDPLVPAEDRVAALSALEGAGLAGVPHLVARLAAPDAFFAEDRRVEPGPLHEGPAFVTATSVRFEVEALLYRLVTPHETSLPGLGPGAPPEPAPPPPYIDDWSAWWAELAGAPAEAVLADARRRLDAARPRTLMPAIAGRAFRPGVPAPPPAGAPAPADAAAYAEGRAVVEALRARSMTPAEADLRLARLGDAHPALSRHVARWRRTLTDAR